MSWHSISMAKAAAAAKAAGNNSIGIACDITDPSVRAAFDTAVATFGGVDIVVSMRVRPGKARSPRWTTRCCARVSS